MRRIVIAGWLAATSLVAAAPAVAESLISLPPLAPGEVLLEIGGAGVVRTPADRALVSISVHATGKTRAEAERNVQAMIGRVRAAARAAGAQGSDVLVTSQDQDIYLANAFTSLDMNMTMDDDTLFAGSSITVMLNQPANTVSFIAAVRGIDGTSLEQTVYSLADRVPARRAARTQAMAAARADAEAYAASMGMRVARVLRITERESSNVSAFGLVEDPEIRSAMMEGYTRGGSVSAQVPTHVLIGVDFALAPR